MAAAEEKKLGKQAQQLAERLGIENDRNLKVGSVGERYGVRTRVRKFFEPETKVYLKWLYEQSEGYRFAIVFITILRCIVTYISVRSSLINKDLLDAVQLGDFDLFYRSAAMLVIVIFGTKVLEYINYYFSSKTLTSLVQKTRIRTFNNALRKDYAEVSRVRSQDWIERIRNDASVVCNTVLSETASLIQLGIQLITSIDILYSLDPTFIVLAVVSLIPTIFTYRVITPINREYAEVQRAVDIRVNSFLQEYILNMSVVRAFGIHDYAEEKAEHTFGIRTQLGMDMVKWSIQTGILYDIYGFITGTGLTIYCGYSILMGRMTYGSMGALISLFGQFRGTAKAIINVLPSFVSLFVHVERLVNLEQLNDTLSDDFLTDDEVHAFYDNELVELGLSDVSFSYPKLLQDKDEEIIGEKDDKLVLQDTSIRLKKGEFTAITGVSGYGKSTIMKLLLGLYAPDTGEYYIKTKSKTMPYDPKYQKLFAYVPQGNMLMQGSIREAVTFGIESFFEDEEGIWEALRLACADEFVSEFKDGIDTVLGELGSGLSEGQTQRLSLARAIYSQHPIIMLDESTSALDPNTERRVLENLRNLHNRTLVIITHRQSVVDACDQNIHFGTEEL